jgi:hypothetical protein
MHRTTVLGSHSSGDLRIEGVPPATVLSIRTTVAA